MPSPTSDLDTSSPPQPEVCEQPLTILVVHEVDWLTKVVYEIHDFTEHLARRGNRVLVVDFEESWQRAGVLDLYRSTRRLTNVSRATGGAGCVELVRPPLVKLPLLDRVSAVPIHAAAINRLIQREQVDVVLLYSAPTNGVGTVLAARRHRVPVVFRAIDVLHRMRSRWLSLPVLGAERLVLRLSDHVVANSPRLSLYAKQMGRRNDEPDVLLPGVATDVFHPQPRDPELAASLGVSDDDRVVAFVGTFFEFAGLDALIRGLPQMREAAASCSVKLLLIGGGGDEEKLRDQAHRQGVADQVIFTGFQPYAEMGRYLSLADVTVNPMRLCPITRDIVPAKIHQYLACGKPLVATPLPGVREVLPGEEAGVVFSEIENMPACLGRLLADPRRCTLLGQAGRDFIDAHHSWPVQTQRLEAILRNQVAGRSPNPPPAP